MTNIRVSQEALEILLSKYPNLRASQLTIEVLKSLVNLSNTRTSQMSIEVLITTTPPIPTVGRVLGPPVQMI